MAAFHLVTSLSLKEKTRLIFHIPFASAEKVADSQVLVLPARRKYHNISVIVTSCT
jgi:hypothetical protein